MMTKCLSGYENLTGFYYFFKSFWHLGEVAGFTNAQKYFHAGITVTLSSCIS